MIDENKRIEIMESVKQITLLPVLNVATIEMVADYFEIDICQVRNFINNNIDNFIKHGLVKLYKDDFEKAGYSPVSRPGYKLLSYKSSSVKVGYRGLNCLTKEAILFFASAINKQRCNIAKKIVDAIFAEENPDVEIHETMTVSEFNNQAEGSGEGIEEDPFDGSDLEYKESAEDDIFDDADTVYDENNECQHKDDTQIFTYQDNNIRTIQIDGEPWFVAVDVCRALGIGNPRQAVSYLDDDEKMSVTTNDGHSGHRGGAQSLNVINEPGLYALILRSRKPEAKPFRKWVTSEVLPSIRKHGMYATDELLMNPDLAIAAFTALKEEREKNKMLSDTIVCQNAQIEAMKPKVSYYDVVLNCKDLVPVSVISKDCGWSAQKMNEYLHDKGIQYKQGDVWMLYQKHADSGYTGTRTCKYTNKDGSDHVRMHTYWTQKGRLFIYDTMKRDGIVPVIEREIA